MQKWLDGNDILMSSTYNKGKKQARTCWEVCKNFEG